MVAITNFSFSFAANLCLFFLFWCSEFSHMLLLSHEKWAVKKTVLSFNASNDGIDLLLLYKNQFYAWVFSFIVQLLKISSYHTSGCYNRITIHIAFTYTYHGNIMWCIFPWKFYTFGRITLVVFMYSGNLYVGNTPQGNIYFFIIIKMTTQYLPDS